MKRKIVEIDESRCDGCGDCIPSCAEGAIQLLDGKARLVGDRLCDGLGACLGECEKGALRVVERDAEAFDEAAVERHLASSRPAARPALAVVQAVPAGGACPGSRAVDFGRSSPRRGLAVVGPGPEPMAAAGGSRLSQWPVQLHLVPTHAPWFRGADLLVAADCVPFAYARFHDDLLAGRRVVVGCPKLDDNQAYAGKLAEILRLSDVRSVTVAKMEVPCCGGIAWAARQALARAGKAIPYREVTVGVRGELLP
ncbi:MAG TPA: ferredoxin [Anaeromyxobacteraceae bacterium]|nr:ferredoxin [Anaeromyxobacteraceae bacterium]